MNSFSFTGRLTRDADFRVTPSGLAVLKVSVANNTGFGDKQKTNYVNCTLFGKRAESKLKDILKKGQEVAVSGELNLNQFTKKDGTASSSLECNVNSIDLIGGKPAASSQGSQESEFSPPDHFDEVPF